MIRLTNILLCLFLVGCATAPVRNTDQSQVAKVTSALQADLKNNNLKAATKDAKKLEKLAKNDAQASDKYHAIFTVAHDLNPFYWFKFVFKSFFWDCLIILAIFLGLEVLAIFVPEIKPFLPLISSALTFILKQIGVDISSLFTQTPKGGTQNASKT